MSVLMWLLHSIAWHVGGILAPVLAGGVVALGAVGLAKHALRRLKRSLLRRGGRP